MENWGNHLRLENLKFVLSIMEKSFPFSFVLDYLPAEITVKKLFGMQYIYLRRRILMILRQSPKQPRWNGIWVATSAGHHASLKALVPELGAFIIDGDDRHSNWLLLNEDAEDFESAAIKICELIMHGDARIGKLTENPPL